MMVTVKTFQPPEIRLDEILRYSLADRENPPTELISECLSELSDKLIFKVASIRVSVKIRDEFVDFGFTKVRSSSLAKNLSGCTEAVIFGATVGIEIDRLIKKYAVLSPAKSLIFQAIGAERCESLCNIFDDEVTKTAMDEGRKTKPRFSPGYGDFPLDFQRDIFATMSLAKNIGITLNNSLLMSPSKSVTAVIGIE